MFDAIGIFLNKDQLVLYLEAESLKKCRQIRLQVVTDSKYQPVSVFELLLLTAELELNVREMFRHLFTEKRATWERSKGNCVGRLSELADVFGGEKPLSRIEKNGISFLRSWLLVIHNIPHEINDNSNY